MVTNLQFEEAKLNIIAKLTKLEYTNPNLMFLGEISGVLKCLEIQQIIERRNEK